MPLQFRQRQPLPPTQPLPTPWQAAIEESNRQNQLLTQPFTDWRSELERIGAITGAGVRVAEAGLTRGRGFKQVFAEHGIPAPGLLAFLAQMGIDPSTYITAGAGRLAAVNRAATVPPRLAPVAERVGVPAAEAPLSIKGEPITRARPLTAVEQTATQTTQSITPQEVVAAQRTGETFAQTHQRLITERIAANPSTVTETPVQRLVAALKAAKPVRAEQEALYSAERTSRIAASAEAGAKVTGQAGLAARLGPLKGQLPKAEFTPLSVSQADKNFLFDQVANSPFLNGYNVPKAMVGLQKLLESGVVPQEGELTLLGRTFGADFVQAAQSAGLRERATGIVGQTLGVFRSLMTFWDYSFPGRQGIFAAPRYARQFGGNFKPMFEASFRDQSYEAIAQEVAGRPNFTNGVFDRMKLALSAIDRVGVSREEVYAMSNLAERIPGVGRLVTASNRAYSAFATKYRADIADAILPGITDNPASLTDAQLEAIGSFVNTITGRGELRNIPLVGRVLQTANGLSTTIFAPRLMASRLSLINPFYYINLDPIIRKEALKTAAMFYGSVATVLGAVAAAGIKVANDYRSADFGKIVVPVSSGLPAATLRILPGVFGVGVQTYAGQTRYEITGGVTNYIRLIGQLVSGKTVSSITGLPKTVRGRPYTRYEILKDFVENKYSPVASAIKEFLNRESRPRAHPYNVTEEIVSRVTPMVLQDYYDLTNGGQETLGQSVDRWIREFRRTPDTAATGRSGLQLRRRAVPLSGR